MKKRKVSNEKKRRQDETKKCVRQKDNEIKKVLNETY